MCVIAAEFFFLVEIIFFSNVFFFVFIPHSPLSPHDGRDTPWRYTVNRDMIYQTLDLNNDGMISQKELSVFVRRLEVLGKLPSEYPTVISLMAAFDTNKDGSISKAEFLNMASSVDFSSVASLDPSKA